jgi:hypothetical protein
MGNEHEPSQGSDRHGAPVQSELTFLQKSPLWDLEKPYRLRYMPFGDIPRTNILLETFGVSLYDIRPSIANLSLDVNGYEIHHLDSRLGYADFFDYEKVHSVYMKEVQELVKEVCRAKHAHTLDYEVTHCQLRGEI